MLSRVALLTCWMARYLERAENSARILDTTVQLSLDVQSHAPEKDRRVWEPVVYACGSEALFHRLKLEAGERSVVEFVVFNRDNPSSIASCVAQARENARCIREQIASEMWEQLNKTHLRLRSEGWEDYAAAGASDYLQRIKTDVQLFFGITESMFPRTDNDTFLQLGRMLERADNVSRIIDVKYFTLLPGSAAVGSAVDVVQWAAVLRSCSAFEAFRRTGHGRLTLERILQYLVLEEHFPRSVLHAVAEARALACRLAGPACASDPLHTHLARLETELRATSAEAIIAAGLHEWMDRIQIHIGEAHRLLLETYIHYPVETAPVVV